MKSAGPRALDLRQRSSALDRLPDLAGPADDVERELLRLELVRRPPPREVAWREPPRDRDDREAGDVGPETCDVGDVDLHAVALPPRPFVEGRGEPRGAKDDARKLQPVQRVGVRF